MIRYSIIMPAYNSEKTIAKAMDSVLTQNIEDLELIVVDDGSTDGTKKVVEQKAKQDKRIKYFSQINSGPGKARNFGIDKANGQFICFLDSDDYWDHLFLDKVTAKIEKDNSDIVYYDTIREDNKQKQLSLSRPSHFKNKTREELINLQLAGTLEWGMTKVVKTSIIKNNGIVFSDIPVGEEAVFSVDILRYASSISFIDEPIYHYVDSIDGQHKKGDLDPWFLVVEQMEIYLKKWNDNYKECVDSLSMKSLAINVNRICKNYKYKKAKNEIKTSISKYEKKYNPLGCNKKNLLRSVYIVQKLLKLHLYRVIYLLAKVRG